MVVTAARCAAEFQLEICLKSSAVVLHTCLRRIPVEGVAARCTSLDTPGITNCGGRLHRSETETPSNAYDDLLPIGILVLIHCIQQGLEPTSHSPRPAVHGHRPS
jgi:hypothetical protein